MAINLGPRNQKLAAVFEHRNQASTHNILTSGSQRAAEAAAAIESSPAALLLSHTAVSGIERPVVPARPSNPRYRKKSEPTPPASPQEGFYCNRGPGMGMNDTSSHVHRPLTPEPFVATSKEGLKEELGAVKVEIVYLKERLTKRDGDIQDLGRRFDELSEKYDKAIFDLKRSQVEKNELQDQVERLREQLARERSAKKEMETELEKKQNKVRELNERLVEMSDDIAERARKSAQDAETNLNLARVEVRNDKPVKNVEKERRTKNQVHLYVDERSEGLVRSILSPPSLDKKLRRREKAREERTRWIPA